MASRIAIRSPRSMILRSQEGYGYSQGPIHSQEPIVEPQESDFHSQVIAGQDSQYAPTPGYYEHTPPSEYGFSPSPDRCPQDGPDPLFSTQPEVNKLLQLSEWEANRPDDELPASFAACPRWSRKSGLASPRGETGLPKAVSRDPYGSQKQVAGPQERVSRSQKLAT